MPSTHSSLHLCQLPYDIRHLLYSYLFPDGEQIYLQARQNKLHHLPSIDAIPVGLFLVNRQLSSEAQAYLCNSYVFNIIGPRHDCLRMFSRFVQYVETHARAPVSVNAFGNGAHSRTMCISILAGTGKMSIVRHRQRGEWQDIDKLHREFVVHQRSLGAVTLARWGAYLHVILVVVFAVALALWARAWPRHYGNTLISW